MNAVDLKDLRAGFEDEATGSQRVFRTALDALSHPGRPIALDAPAQSPRTGHHAAALLLLALVDADCDVWLSPRLRGSDAATWLRFHTGARLADDPAQAHFLWVGLGDALPALDTLRQGSDKDPDQAATCVIEALAFAEGTAEAGTWSLRGPGIPGERRFAATGLPEGFAAQWSANQAAFPRGVDVFLATPTQLAGLPRTTRLTLAERT